MKTTVDRTSPRGLAALRRLTSAQPRVERCELCAAPAGEEHQHLVDPENRRILCVCDACAILFDHSGATRYRRVPRDSRRADEMDDAMWNSLGIPIGLAFLFRSSASNGVIAIYPSPGGPAEIAIEDDFPALAPLAPDVEALLVNRTRGARDCYIVPIDACYRLIGIVRRHWSGFSGGDELWNRVDAFFDALRRHSGAGRSAGHA